LPLLLLAPSIARAEVHGGVEIGAKGVKATVLDVTATKTGYDLKVLLADTKNTTLSAKISDSGEPDSATLKETVKAVADFLAVMQNKHKVPKDHLYVVASSGVLASVSKNPKAVATGQKALADAIRQGTGQTLDFITIDQEAELSILGIIPKQHRDASLLIDIGSGNTKGGYRVEAKKFLTFGVQFGTVTFGEAAKKKYPDEPLPSALARASESILRPALKSTMKEKPGLLTRKRIYLSGGSVWAMATFMKPGDRDSFTAITAADVARYRKALAASPKEYPKVDLESIRDKEVRTAAEKELARVKKTFTPEQMLAGAEILSALSAEFEFGEGKKQAYFARHGYLGWILAYVARKSVE